MQHSPDIVLSFWFDEITPNQWWEKSPVFDQLIARRFGTLHDAAAACELFAWRETARGRLAEILVLDQFSRNIYRDQGLAFACDPLALALALAQTAVAVHADKELAANECFFLYMPYMHSESSMIHVEAMALFDMPGLEDGWAFERKHKVIIDRFGRFPHRNVLLGRESTPQEQEFLNTPGSSF